MYWSKTEINYIRISLDRWDAQKLANELGRAKENVKRKMREIDAKQRLAKLTQYAKNLKNR